MTWSGLWDRHPAVRTGGELSVSERVSDAVVGAMGTMRFVVIQTAVVAVWITLNLAAVVWQWDPYPFILLNLAFSTQAAYASPLILIGQKRSDVRTAEVAMHTLKSEEASQRLLVAVARRALTDDEIQTALKKEAP